MKGKKVKIDKIKKDKPIGNNSIISCLDADYDFLLDNENLKSINIFHTYTHSKENYSCIPEALNELLIKYTTEIKIENCNFVPIIKKYSEIASPVLSKIYENNDNSIIDFGQSIHSTKDNCMNDFIKKYEISINSSVFDKNSPELLNKGFIPEDTYLYIRGHNIFTVVLNLLNCCKENMKLQQIINLKKTNKNDEDKKNLRREINNIFKKNIMKDLLETNYEYAFKNVDKIKPLQLLKKDIEKKIIKKI